MVVLPIILALALNPCEAGLEPVTAALQANDLARASSLLASISPECSHSSSFYSLTGVTQELSGRTADAETAFQKAISLDPKSVRLKEQLGATYLRNRKAREAASVLQEAVALDSANPALKKYLIGAYVDSEFWDKAMAMFGQLGEKITGASDPILVLWFAKTLIGSKQFDRLNRDLSPEDVAMPPPLLFSLGTLLAEHGMYQPAVNYFRRVPEKDADEAVYFNLGLAYSHLHAYNQARENYFLAIDRRPEHTEAYFRVGLDYAALGDSRKAVPWLFRARECAPARVEITYTLIEQLTRLNYFVTAQEVLDQAASESPVDPLLTVARADLAQARGETTTALTGYRSVLTQRPGFSPALIGLAGALIEQGKDADARPNLLVALSQDPENASANAALGSIELRQENWPGALEHLAKAWAQDNSNPAIALSLSRAERHLNRAPEALNILLALALSLRQSPAYHQELAQVYSQLHKPAQARTERKLLVELQAEANDGLHFDTPKTYVH